MMRISRKTLVTLLLASVLIFAAMSLSPELVALKAVPVELTRTTRTGYSSDVFASGNVEERAKKDVIAKLPLVPGRVYVDVGDYVNVGDLLADVDADATTAALLDLSDSLNLIPQEYVEAIASLDISPEMAQKYIPQNITAPASGVITAISMTAGSICSPNMAVATISDQEELRLKLAISENDIGSVKTGDTVVFKAVATGDQKYIGYVDTIFPAAAKTLVGTSQATIVNIYVRLKENYPDLKPGYSVTGAVKAPTERTIQTLPYECVKQDSDNGEYVYIASADGVQRCAVQTGMELSDRIEIVTPMLDGQYIVKNPNDIVDENCIIKVVEGTGDAD